MRSMRRAKLMAFALVFIAFPLRMPIVQAEELFPYVQTFRVSAYYSPCEGQSYYVTGSYEGDIRLNGNGVHGADGTPVYAGMIAAPKIYPFGTKMSIPGIGLTAVHDRGGAIVPAGERGQSYDRLDVWMGACEPGLERALNWGLKTVDVTVYGLDESVSEEVYFEEFTASEAIVKNVILAPELFPEDVWYLSSGEDVKKLQGFLMELNYFAGPVTGYYGDDTREAVVQFQLDNGVISSVDDFGAGHTGVNTRKMLDLVLAKFREEQDNEELQAYQKGLLLIDSYPDLGMNRISFSRDLVLGMSGEDVRILQYELTDLGYLRVEATGYYGEVTEHAVFKFQQKMGVLSAQTDAGAGVFGPNTRATLNRIVESRTRALSGIALNRSSQSDSLIASSDTSKISSLVRTLSFGDRGADVKTLQTLLRELGFFKGVMITEYYGEQTQSAVQNFQLKNNLIASNTEANAGQVDEVTLAALKNLL